MLLMLPKLLLRLEPTEPDSLSHPPPRLTPLGTPPPRLQRPPPAATAAAPILAPATPPPAPPPAEDPSSVGLLSCGLVVAVNGADSPVPAPPASLLSLLGSLLSRAALLQPLTVLLTGTLLRSEVVTPPSLPDAHTLLKTSLLLPPLLLIPLRREATEPSRAVTAALVLPLLPGTADDSALLLPG